ncbi:MAG: sulfur relay protein DsrC [Gammaproteobacteria bacterium]|nr:sulfur relay protein DsrC [Gammaproteobacteria bacterium]
MIYLSEVLIQNPHLNSFDDLMNVIREVVKQTNEVHLKIDIKPNYQDTPANWEDKIEGAFSGVHSVIDPPKIMTEDDF